MKLIPSIQQANSLPGYNLWVEFADGIKGKIDLNKWVGNGLFSYWSDPKNFETFIITTDKKLRWTDDIEMDPDAFYLQLIDKTFDEYAGDQQLLRHSY